MFEPIIRYLPRYLDTDPDLRPALQWIAPTNASWRVHEDRLTIAWGDQHREYDLTEHTLASLVDALQAEGFTLTWYDHDLLALGAVILWDGRGTLDNVDGTQWRARTSVLYALTRPVEREWVRMRDAVPEAAEQVAMATADGEWLDRHGALYGVPRPPGFSDEAYRDWILEEIRRPRDNARGMEYTLRRLMGKDVRVREPWQWVMRWSVSPMSVDHRLQRGDLWGKNLLQLVAREPVDWARARAIANADRAAGCLLIDPAWEPVPPHILLNPAAGVWPPTLMRTDTVCRFVRGIWHPRWCVSRLSDHEVTRNYRFTRTDWIASWVPACIAPRPGAVAGGATWSGGWGKRTWGRVCTAKPVLLNQGRHFCRGDTVWSEGPPLGDINARFRGAGYEEWIGASRRASVDMALSDYAVEHRRVPICEWIEQPLGDIKPGSVKIYVIDPLRVTYIINPGATPTRHVALSPTGTASIHAATVTYRLRNPKTGIAEPPHLHARMVYSASIDAKISTVPLRWDDTGWDDRRWASSSIGTALTTEVS